MSTKENTLQLSTHFPSTSRQVGRFILSSHKENAKKKLSLQSKYKCIKNTMVTGIAQKATKLYFHCGPLRKNIVKLINQQSRREKIESIRKILDIESMKKVKLYVPYFL